MKTLKLKKELRPTIGLISQVTKLPYPSWSLSAFDCKTGGQLAKIEGSVCHGCYAMKGNYQRFHRHTYDENQEAYLNKGFVDKFIEFININKLETFRWFDSGDLQNEILLMKIGQIADGCPNTKFWLPTRERQILENYSKMNKGKKLNKLHPNLVIRLSANFVNKDPDYKFAKKIGVLVSSVKTGDTNCRVFETNNQCGDCRKCTDINIFEISYKLH